MSTSNLNKFCRPLILFAVLLLDPAGAHAAPNFADLVLLNGSVYTVDAARSSATAVVVTGERITYVGNDLGAKTYVGPATRVVDLNRRLLLPGFQDSHVHPGMVPDPRFTLDLSGLPAKESIFDKIRAFAQEHPSDPWIVGTGYDGAAFPPDRRPTRQMLDAIVRDRPVFINDNSVHDAWVNTRALELAKISARTPDPPNGRIERDGAGNPTGLLHEVAAQDLVKHLIPPISPQRQAASLMAALNVMTQLGFTALEDAMVTPEIGAAYKMLESKGLLRQHVRLCLLYHPEKDDEPQIESFLEQRRELAGKWLTPGCVKIFLDGAAPHALALLAPYTDDPGFGNGKLFVDPPRLDRVVARLDAAGFQVHMHAFGDGAVRAGLDAVEYARRANGDRDNRPVLAHLWLVDPADIPRFRKLGVIANMTPIWSVGDAWETLNGPRQIGAERSKHVYPTRSLVEAGAVLTWGSDWPVTSVSPFDGMETAVTHRYPGGQDPEGRTDTAWRPQEHVDIPEAITAYTAAGAYQSHEELERGSLVPGKLADMVVLDGDLFALDPLAIHKTKVDMTIFGGKVAYSRTH